METQSAMPSLAPAREPATQLVISSNATDEAMRRWPRPGVSVNRAFLAVAEAYLKDVRGKGADES